MEKAIKGGTIIGVWEEPKAVKAEEVKAPKEEKPKKK